MFGDDSPCPSDSQPVFFKHAPDAGFASVRLGCWETPQKKNHGLKMCRFQKNICLYLHILYYIITQKNIPTSACFLWFQTSSLQPPGLPTLKQHIQTM